MSRGGFTLGKILGIEITVDYSWFIIFLSLHGLCLLAIFRLCTVNLAIIQILF